MYRSYGIQTVLHKSGRLRKVEMGNDVLSAHSNASVIDVRTACPSQSLVSAGYCRLWCLTMISNRQKVDFDGALTSYVVESLLGQRNAIYDVHNDLMIHKLSSRYNVISTTPIVQRPCVTIAPNPLRFGSRHGRGEEYLPELLGFGIDTAHGTIVLSLQGLDDASTWVAHISMGRATNREGLTVRRRRAHNA